MNNKKTDVLVIGGGPAGTTCATLLKQKGYKVTLLEKDHHPRFHIGESLLPMNLPILERLGVLDAVKSIGVDKLGADFSVGNRQIGEQTFYFKEALGDSPPQAYEVRRADFDQLLFENCKKNGVQALEGMKVRQVEAIKDGCHRVTAIDEVGNEQTWETRFLIDASGRDTFMSSKNGWKKPNPKHASAAIYSHFTGVSRRPGKDQGNISIYWFDSGWIWMIPLQNDIMSIGMVCYPDHLKTRKNSRDEFLMDTLNSLVETKQRMQGAHSVMPAVATGNYSYISEKMHGPGYLMVGDAFTFIDPVFSSGVYLAMHSAQISAPLAEAWLGPGHRGYKRACQRYEKEIRKGVANFSWFIYRFNNPVMQRLMGNPKNDMQIAQAVISMLAGDVFNNPMVGRRLRLFRAIYAITWLFNWREASAYRKLHKSRLNVDSQ
jgi:flavin-dependent dehydrogenase